MIHHTANRHMRPKALTRNIMHCARSRYRAVLVVNLGHQLGKLCAPKREEAIWE